MRDSDQMVDVRAVSALLDPVDRLAVEVDALGELLLAQVAGCTGGANMVSDLAAAGEHPLGQGIGRHPYTLSAPMIFVCTIFGTSRERLSARTQEMI